MSIDNSSSRIDRVTETTSTSWLGRLANSVGGVIFGLFLVLVCVGVLFWNEGRAVTTALSLDEGKGLVVPVDGGSVDPANEGKLVHVTGEAKVAAPLVDPLFGVTAPGIRLVRKVEMYQWQEESRSETQKKLGGGEETVTTYSYSLGWNPERIDSSDFHLPAGHENPEMAITGDSFQAPAAAFGAFTLGENVLSQVGGEEALPLKEADKAGVEAAAGEIGRPVRLAFGKIVIGDNVNTPALGDLRITYQRVAEGPLSIIGKQQGQSFAAYQTKAGDALLMVDSGLVDSATMFADAASANVMITWIVRAVGLGLLFLGFSLIFNPVAVLADIIPVFGTLVGIGTGLIAFLCAVVVGSVTIAIAWFWYRPLLSLIVLAGGAVIAIGIVALMRSRRKAPAAPATA